MGHYETGQHGDSNLRNAEREEAGKQ